MQYIEEKAFKHKDYSQRPLILGEHEVCSFLNCNFSDSDLSEIKFIGCEFYDCNFSNAKLDNTAFQDVKFQLC